MAAKRRLGLRELSDDHHTALVIARRCRRSDAATVGAIWREVRKARDAHFEPHFTLEESYLLPALEALSRGDLAERVWRDHEALRLALDETEPQLDRVREFGELLHAHVRFEEREIFDPLQDTLPEVALKALASACEQSPTRFDLGPLNDLR